MWVFVCSLLKQCFSEGTLSYSQWGCSTVSVQTLKHGKIHRLSFRDVLPKSYCSLQPEAVDICMSISTAVFVMVIQNCDVEDLF